MDSDTVCDDELLGDDDKRMEELEALIISESIADLKSKHEQYTRALNSCTDVAMKDSIKLVIENIQALLKDSEAGRVIAKDAIPPPVDVEAPPKNLPSAVGADLQPTCSGDDDSISSGASLNIPSHLPSISMALANDVSVSTQEAGSYKDPIAAMLVQRRNEYQDATLEAKRSGDEQSAKYYQRIRNKFDLVLTAREKGQSIDLTDLPPSLSGKPTASSTEAAQQSSLLDDIAALTIGDSGSMTTPFTSTQPPPAKRKARKEPQEGDIAATTPPCMRDASNHLQEAKSSREVQQVKPTLPDDVRGFLLKLEADLMSIKDLKTRSLLMMDMQRLVIKKMYPDDTN